MGSRFEIVDKEYILSENENTKKSMEYWKNVFKTWVNERNFQTNLEEYKSNVLNQTLSQFYAFRNSIILPCMLLTSDSNGSL